MSEYATELSNAIAIIGMAGRFPGAATVAAFWQNLEQGADAIRRLSEEELQAAGVAPAFYQRSDYVRAAADLPDIDAFAAEFFGYTPKEAQITDPQHRIFMECAWEALEDAAQVPGGKGARVGVYAGAGLNTYMMKCLLPHGDALAAEMGMLSLVIGNKADFMATQLSYKLDLQGPSVAVNTACSTSLVATHMACQALLSYECDLALAGGVTIQVPQVSGYLYQPGGVFSPDGHCRPFDAAAQGTVPGNGAGVVVLKRLDDAIADGDAIYAVIRGTATNNDGGRKIGYTAPSVEGQCEVIRTALAVAGVEASSIGYVETHGTATALGDPLELKALTQAYEGTGIGHCAIGSVKSNIGHLDAAAGVASLIKTALCLQHRRLVPSLHFSAPNPQLQLAQSPFYVNTATRDWQTSGTTPLRAAVSSFGIGGTNAHVVLEAWTAAAVPPSSRSWQILPVSARSTTALQASAARIGGHWQTHAEARLDDLAYTLQCGRRAFAERRAFVCRTREAVLPALLGAAAATAERADLSTFSGTAVDAALPVTFLFPGMGEQYLGMARGLYAREPVFRKYFDLCAALLRQHADIDLQAGLYPAQSAATPAPGFDLRALMGRGAATSGAAELTADERSLRRTGFAHPALFTIEYALAQLWLSWGLRPTAMIGHSLGEYVAACLAGVFSLEDAVKLVARRAALIENLPAGGMLAVALPEDELLAVLPQDLSLAAVNAATLCVVAGPVPALQACKTLLAARGIAHREVQAGHAFHSSMMEAIKPQLQALFAGVSLQAPQLAYLSNLSGDWIRAEQATDPTYWAEHTCRTVRFAAGLARLQERGAQAYVEVGPGQSLASFVYQHCAGETREQLHIVQSLPAAHEAGDDEAYLARALASLWCAGVAVDWAALHAEAPRQRLHLPTYPFERKRYWIEPPALLHAAAPASPFASPAPAAADGAVTTAASPLAPVATTRPPYLAPDGDIEALLAEQWGTVLGLTPIGRDDHFFRLGGSSLLAIQLLTRIRDSLQLELPLKAVFEHPTLRAFSAHIEECLLAELEALPDDEAERQAAQIATPATAPSPSARAASFEALPYDLPNGIRVLQFNPVETAHFYHDIFETRVYARNGVEVPNGGVVFDVGANIGLFSLFTHLRTPQTQIYAFEPAPPVFEALRRNLQAAGAKVHVYNKGVAAVAGRRELTFYPYSTGMSSFHADLDEEREALRAILQNQAADGVAGMQDVMQSLDDLLEHRFQSLPFTAELCTVSDVIREHGITHIDLLKIDVQKAEAEVLAGIDDAHWPGIRQIVIEVHDIDGRVAAVAADLTARGYEVHVEQDALYQGSNISNLYALRRR